MSKVIFIAGLMFLVGCTDHHKKEFIFKYKKSQVVTYIPMEFYSLVCKSKTAEIFDYTANNSSEYPNAYYAHTPKDVGCPNIVLVEKDDGKLYMVRAY